MFSGLSAFPLTPMNETGIDEKAFVRLIKRLVAAGVDSIGALGSTGSYAYLSRDERMRVTQLAVEKPRGPRLWLVSAHCVPAMCFSWLRTHKQREQALAFGPDIVSDAHRHGGFFALRNRGAFSNRTAVHI